jgi:hypothetical protein
MHHYPIMLRARQLRTDGWLMKYIRSCQPNWQQSPASCAAWLTSIAVKQVPDVGATHSFAVPWPCVQPSPSRTPQSIYVPCESVSSYAWFASKQQQEQAPTVSDTAAVMCDVKLIQGCINICLFHYKFT